MHISSLPSKYGIGTFGEEAFRFVDFLCDAGQKYWQMLPLGMTGFANSPYQSASAFAGNIFFIDLDILQSQGYLKADDFRHIDWEQDKSRVDYAKVYANRANVLKKAVKSFDRADPGYTAFCAQNSFWLDDFALFMAVKEHHGMLGLDKWGQGYRLRDEALLASFSNDNRALIDFYKITQFWFYRQMDTLKQYANNRGISVIGDIAFYVAYDSADVWAEPGLFELDENLVPKNVAGVPPDAFSDKGQLWGNPLYDYENMRKDDYEWWRRRVTHCFKQCDILRIDHFRAFDSYFAIPYSGEDATTGEWRKGEGMRFIDSLCLTDMNIIVEDLGDLGESVRELVKKTGLPNMKILQFAFDSGPDNEFLPRNYNNNCVVYTGTHDNNTIKGWYKTLSLKEKAAFLRYVPSGIFIKKSKALIRYAQQSAADIAVIPMQDYLDLGESARMNMPSTIKDNWEWRAAPEEISPKVSKYIRAMSRS